MLPCSAASVQRSNMNREEKLNIQTEQLGRGEWEQKVAGTESALLRERCKTQLSFVKYLFGSVSSLTVSIQQYRAGICFALSVVGK